MPNAKRRSTRSIPVIEEPVIPEVSEKKNKLNYVLVVLLIIASFVIGSLYTKVQTLEKGGGTTAQVANPGQQPSAGPVEVKVTDNDPSLGNKNAKVTVVIFEDFQCPFCGAFSGYNAEMVKNMQSRDPNWQPAEPNIKKDYVENGKVRFVWKDYPFLGQESFLAAQAARCAQDQGKFWEYHEKLFSSQNGENQGAFAAENLKKFAADLGLKTTDFNNCLDSKKHEKLIQDAVTFGQSVGVSGTPATFINGRLISGAASYPTVKAQIDALLQ